MPIDSKWPFPVNRGHLGLFPEEVKDAQKRIEKNPQASPMPEVAPLNFLAPEKSSDHLRMGEPAMPLEANDAFTATLTHVVLRRVLTKMRRRGAVLFDEAIDEEPLEDHLPSGRRRQMRALVAREQALLELLDRYNSLAESVYMRLLATSKG